MWVEGKRIKTTTRDAAPAVLLTVGVDAVQPPVDDTRAGHPYVFGGVHVCASRRQDVKWSAIKAARIEDWAAFWAWCDEAFKGRSRVYVVSANALDDLTLLHFWEEMQGGKASFLQGKDRSVSPGKRSAKGGTVRKHPLVFGDRADIIGFQRGGTSYRWVSATNWADLSLADMARQVQYPVPPCSTEGERWRANPWPAQAVAEMLHQFMRTSFGWWISEGCGTWKDTPGAAAYSSWLRQGGERNVIKHEHAETLVLEDKACFGGRAQAWFFGAFGDPSKWGELAGAPTPRNIPNRHRKPIHRYDVRAMYPTLLRDHLFPLKLIDWENKCSVKRLSSRIQQVLAVAAVRVRTDKPLYPLKTENGPAYPVGQFDTVLTTPELQLAISRGHLMNVWEASFYTPGRPYGKWASWVLNLRDVARLKKDPAAELWVKTFANAFGGRLGRKPVGWVDDATVMPRAVWGQWSYDHPDYAVPQLYRSICGRVQRMERDEQRPGTLAAGYAHLCAYGRVMMQRIREAIGDELVYWQDTDGILVSDAARATVERSKWYDPDRYGFLRHDATYTHGHLVTAKHYWLDGTWTLSGVAHGFTVDDLGWAAEMRTINPVRDAQEPRHHGTYQFAQRIRIDDIDPGAKIGDDGWLVPPRIWVGERPEKPAQVADDGRPWWAAPHEQREYLPFTE